MQNAIAKTIQKPREANGGLEGCISVFQRLRFQLLVPRFSRLSSFSQRMSSLAVAAATFTAGGIEILSVSREAGHDDFIGASVDFL